MTKYDVVLTFTAKVQVHARNVNDAVEMSLMKYDVKDLRVKDAIVSSDGMERPVCVEVDR